MVQGYFYINEGEEEKIAEMAINVSGNELDSLSYRSVAKGRRTGPGKKVTRFNGRLCKKK